MELKSFRQYSFMKLIEERIFTKIILAKNNTNDKKFVLKLTVLHSYDEECPEIKRIESEAQILRVLDHPNIVKLRDSNVNLPEEQQLSYTHCKLIFLAEDYLPNGELFDVVKRHSLPENIARTLFLKILSIVEYMHSRNVMHRDIKLDNIMLNEEFDIMLIDFGLAKISSNPYFHDRVGTVGYMSPELLRGDEYNAMEADLFAIGILLFQMCSGHAPFKSAHVLDAFYKPIIQNNLKKFWRMHDKNNQLSENFKDLLSLMFQYQPTDRLSLQQIKNHSWCKLESASKDLVKQSLQY